MARPSDVLDEIIAIIGNDAAMELCRAFGGQSIYLPGFRRFTSERRNQLIAAALATGKAHRDIADEYGVSIRHVRRIKRTCLVCNQS